MTPSLDVRLATTIREIDFGRDRADVAIWCGKGGGHGLRTDALLRSALYPICSPDLMSGRGALRDMRDLRHQTLLHGDRGETWTRWLGKAGEVGLHPSRGIRFDDCNLMIQAAIESQGVAQGLVCRELAEGRLVCPFDLPLESGSWYYLLTPEEWASRLKIKAFREWLLRLSSNGHALSATG